MIQSGYFLRFLVLQRIIGGLQLPMILKETCTLQELLSERAIQPLLGLNQLLLSAVILILRLANLTQQVPICFTALMLGVPIMKCPIVWLLIQVTSWSYWAQRDPRIFQQLLVRIMKFLMVVGPERLPICGGTIMRVGVIFPSPLLTILEALLIQLLLEERIMKD